MCDKMSSGKRKRTAEVLNLTDSDTESDPAKTPPKHTKPKLFEAGGWTACFQTSAWSHAVDSYIHQPIASVSFLRSENTRLTLEEEWGRILWKQPMIVAKGRSGEATERSYSRSDLADFNPLSFILWCLTSFSTTEAISRRGKGGRWEEGGGDGIEPLVKCFLFTKSLVKQNCSRWLATWRTLRVPTTMHFLQNRPWVCQLYIIKFL
jgi:hypothetical protein